MSVDTILKRILRKDVEAPWNMNGVSDSDLLATVATEVHIVKQMCGLRERESSRERWLSRRKALDCQFSDSLNYSFRACVLTSCHFVTDLTI